MGWELLAGLALSAAGAGLGVASNAQDVRSEENTTKDALAAQKPFEQKGSQAFQSNVAQNAGAGNAQSQMAQGQNQALNMYRMLQSQGTGQGTGLTPQDSLTSAMTQGRLGQSNQADAAISGQGAWNTGVNVGNINTNSLLGVNNQQAQQMGAVTPYLLQDATHSGDSLAGIGSLLSSLGMLTGTYGAQNSNTQPSMTMGQSPFATTYANRPQPLAGPYSYAGMFGQGGLN